MTLPNKKEFVVIISLVVTIALAGAATFYFISINNKPSSVEPTQKLKFSNLSFSI